MLLLRPGELVTTASLIDGIWGERVVPGAARNLVQVIVSRLRTRLRAAGIAADLIVTGQSGYRLVVPVESSDLRQFRRLAEQGRSARASGSPGAARVSFRSALSLWRGPILPEIDSGVVRRAAARLEEECAGVWEECVDCELEFGAAGDLVPELTELIDRHPYREGLHGALMLALYRAGRQRDALAAYRRARHLLADELGIEPGAALSQLHQAILNQAPELSRPLPSGPQYGPRRPGSDAPAPQELPADRADFVGRAAALRGLDGLLADGTAGSDAGLPVAVITGTAGVGKTALAVHWAHQVGDEFPDGQLFLNLHGYGAGSPLRPVDALAALLRSLGVPPDQLPVHEEEAAALYRSRVAGRRLLVVLDNAASAGQVRPLLPGEGACLVLVTSRSRLAGLVARDGARWITLDVFTMEESRTLLTRLLGPGPVRAEAESAVALARACAHLPLALRIAAANLTCHPDWTVARYLADLVAGDRLSRLQADGDHGSAVRANFTYSYRRLSAAAQRMFRLIGLLPGADLPLPAAAALAGIRPDRASDLLARLTSVHMLEETTPDRYTCHDLLRLYARELVQRERVAVRQQATQRLLGWYVHRAGRAADLLYPDLVRLPGPPGAGPAPEPGWRQPADALAWLDAERSNLVAAVRSAAEAGQSRPAWLLADQLQGYFWQRRHVVDWLAVADVAGAAADREGDLPAQSAMRASLGAAHHVTGNPGAAAENYAEAATIARAAGWVDGESRALANLGLVHIVAGQLRLAREALGQARELTRRSERRTIEAQVLGNLGFLARQAGRLSEAADYCALQIEQYQRSRTADRHNLARSLANFGSVQHDLGRLVPASQNLARALATYREVGGRYGEANALNSLAAVQLEAGDIARAGELVRSAYSLARRLGDSRLEGEASHTLGDIHAAAGRPGKAVDHQRQALEIGRGNRDRGLVIRALVGLAIASSQLGRTERAARYGELARRYAHQGGYLLLEGRAWTALAEVRRSQGRYQDATDCAERALDLHRETGHRPGEAWTLGVLRGIQHGRA